MKSCWLLIFFLAFGLKAADAPERFPSDPPEGTAAHFLKPEIVSFPSGGLTLRGFLYKPAGKGPFPAVIWNHGSEKGILKSGQAAQHPSLAKTYVPKGYALFLPFRHGQGLSPGDYIVDLQEKIAHEEKNRVVVNRKIIELHELYNLDVVAAVQWLKEQPYIDRDKIIMSGLSYGGIQTVLSAEKDLGIRAYIPFAPGAMSWNGNLQLHNRLLQAVKNARAPMFLIQATNDYSLGPSELLGEALKEKGPPNQSKIYPPCGTTPAEGHGFAVTANDIWAPDVFAFIDKILNR